MVRFQADADLNQIIVAALVRRAPGVDFRTAELAHLTGLDDREVLALAAREERILVTHDSKTMPRHFGVFVESQRSAGVIVIPQHLPVSVAVDDLLVIWAATSAEDWTNRICYLPL
jgi:uncharacterized protein with PIN domain